MSQRGVFGLVPMLICCFLTVSESAAQDLHPAVNNPDKFAWGLFVAINHPADLTPSGAPQTKTRSWATWELQCGKRGS